MNLLFWKISTVLLLLACLIIVIDKTKVGIQLNGVGYKIAEKTKIIRENEEKYQKELDALKKEIEWRDSRFHLQLYSQTVPDAVFSGCPQTPDPEDKDLRKTAERIASAPGLRTPNDLIRIFRTKQIEDNILPDRLRIDPETGVAVSRAASILSLAADIAGFEARTTLIWDLKHFTLNTSTEIAAQSGQTAGRAASPEAAPAVWKTKTAGRNANTNADPEPLLIEQKEPSTLVFPFSAEGPFAAETDLIPAGSPFPVGGLYLHHIRISGTKDLMLEYELPEGTAPEDVRLQILPLCAGMRILSASHAVIHSFLIRPDASGLADVLIAGDKPFLPVRITVAPFVPKFEVPDGSGGGKTSGRQ